MKEFICSDLGLDMGTNLIDTDIAFVLWPDLTLRSSKVHKVHIGSRDKVRHAISIYITVVVVHKTQVDIRVAAVWVAVRSESRVVNVLEVYGPWSRLKTTVLCTPISTCGLGSKLSWSSIGSD